jgi:NAD(P)-dependent dehydrogenase (short-subunit alcohol dehydrogenase family)
VGSAGIGRHIAQRLVADGGSVLDVPSKLSARVRALDTGQGRKTDPVDAHSVAVAGLRSRGLRSAVADDVTVALRLLVDRRDELGRTAPLDASSGDQKRHRLSRAGNRRINRVLHIMAVVQLRHDTPGRGPPLC